MIELSYPKDITEIVAENQNDAISFMRITLYDRKSPDQVEPVAGINLPMPANLESTTGSQWGQQSLGAHKAGQGFIDAALDSGQYQLDAVRASMAAKLYGGSSVTGAQLAGFEQKRILNPHQNLLLDAPTMRQTNWVWHFTPLSVDECETIFTIQQHLRRASLTESSADNFKLLYPYEVEAEFLYQGRKHPWLTGWGRGALTDVTVSHTSEAGYFATLRNGYPAATTISVNFAELQPLQRSDVEVTAPSL